MNLLSLAAHINWPRSHERGMNIRLAGLGASVGAEQPVWLCVCWVVTQAVSF